jgi:hypothetical protein
MAHRLLNGPCCGHQIQSDGARCTVPNRRAAHVSAASDAANAASQRREASEGPSAATRRAQASARSDSSAPSNHFANRWSLRSSTSKPMGHSTTPRGLVHVDTGRPLDDHQLRRPAHASGRVERDGQSSAERTSTETNLGQPREGVPGHETVHCPSPYRTSRGPRLCSARYGPRCGAVLVFRCGIMCASIERPRPAPVGYPI